MKAYEPDIDTLNQEFDKRINDLILKTNAGEQARQLLNTDLGREFRNHVLIRSASIKDEIANFRISDDVSIQEIKNLQEDYRILNGVTDLLSLIIMQSEDAIQEFEQLHQQRGD